MFDDLQVDHNVDRGVGERKFGEVALARLHPGVAGADVGDRGLVVIDADDAPGDPGEQVGAVALAEAGLEHLPIGAQGR